MKISIPVRSDDHNSYPSWELIIERVYTDFIVLKLDNRCITVNANELEIAVNTLMKIPKED